MRAREHFVEHDPERPDVRTRIEVRLAVGLFGAHVRRSSRQSALLGRCFAALFADPKVQELRDHAARGALSKKDIFRFYVPMNDAHGVYCRKTSRNVSRNRYGFVRFEVFLAGDSIRERLAFEQLHGQEKLTIWRNFTEICDIDDVWMTKFAEELGFRLEASTGRGIILGAYSGKLEREVSTEQFVACRPDGAHGPPPDGAEESISAGDDVVRVHQRLGTLAGLCIRSVASDSE